MGERKVLNKYFPPNFDPAMLPRGKKKKQAKVRWMLPMTVRCNTCGGYIGKGTKFNARMEATGDAYLGIQIIRFYINCKDCSAEFSITTDPRNSDYTVECGARRNLEPWREEAHVHVVARPAAEDSMKSLEKRRMCSKREMDNLANLEELKAKKARQARVDWDELLAALRHRSADEEKKKLEEADEARVKSAFARSEDIIVRRIKDEDSDSEDGEDRAESRDIKKRKMISEESPIAWPTAKPVPVPSNIRVIRPARSAPARNDPAIVEESKKQGEHNVAATGLQSLCSYGSDDE